MSDISDSQPVDLETALKRMEGDRELFDELLNIFINHVPSLLNDLRSAVGKDDSESVRITAHSLKGAASNICAEPTRAIAERIELMSKAGHMKNVEGALSELEESINNLKDYMGKLETK